METVPETVPSTVNAKVQGEGKGFRTDADGFAAHRNLLKTVWRYREKGEERLMKKKVLSVVLSAAMASAVLAGCGSKGSDTAATEAGSAATEAATAAATEAAAATTEAADTAAINGGRVYLLNFKPETDEAWQELASKYNDLGGNVTVLTAADGQYATTLQSEMAKSEAPTIFNIGNANDVATWKDYLYDLSDSDLYKHVSDHSLDIKSDDKTVAIANCYEAYGIIYNKTLLSDYCTLDNAVIKSPDDIKDFDTLKKVADDLNKRVDEMNEQFGFRFRRPRQRFFLEILRTPCKHASVL